MTKFTDGKKILSIEMVDNATGAAFENDFFEVGGLAHDDELDTYIVDDVEYLADYAQSYADGTNSDFDEAGSCTVSYEITAL